jgi:spore coat polysaccharide biosynthesis protein SpsF
MADGQQNKRIGFVIQARMKSTRLPGKILIPIPLPNGKPLLLWILDELKKSRHKPEIWVATSKNKENDVLAKFCEANGILCFRGEEEDVLSRFLSITQDRQFDVVVRLTADNPLIDISILDECIAHHIQKKNDYTSTKNLPLGMNFEVISAKTLLSAKEANLEEADREHVTLYIKNNNTYKRGEYSPRTPIDLKNLRLTVDYPSDLLVVSTLLGLYDSEKGITGMSLVIEAFNKYPFIFEVNMSNIQKKQFKHTEEEVGHAIEILTNLELVRAARILKQYEEKNSF